MSKLVDSEHSVYRVCMWAHWCSTVDCTTNTNCTGDTRFLCGCAHCVERFAVQRPVVRLAVDFQTPSKNSLFYRHVCVTKLHQRLCTFGRHGALQIILLLLLLLGGEEARWGTQITILGNGWRDGWYFEVMPLAQGPAYQHQSREHSYISARLTWLRSSAEHTQGHHWTETCDATSECFQPSPLSALASPSSAGFPSANQQVHYFLSIS